MVKGFDEGTEKQILDAACRVIISKGKQGTRMQEIADEAGVNKALLHYYFRSKDKLYEAVLQNVLVTILKTITSSIDLSLPMYELLSQFIRRHIKLVDENADTLRFFFSEIWTNKEELAPILQKSLNTSKGELPKMFFARVNKAIKEKEIRNIKPFHLLMNVISLDIFFHFAGPLFFQMIKIPKLVQRKLEKERIEQVIEFVWESIRYREDLE